MGMQLSETKAEVAELSCELTCARAMVDQEVLKRKCLEKALETCQEELSQAKVDRKERRDIIAERRDEELRRVLSETESETVEKKCAKPYLKRGAPSPLCIVGVDKAFVTTPPASPAAA